MFVFVKANADQIKYGRQNYWLLRKVSKETGDERSQRSENKRQGRSKEGDERRLSGLRHGNV